MAPRGYELLRERALLNFETLLTLWKIDYQVIGKDEYDFLSPTRSEDTNLGACRFNVAKGIGSDFAGIAFSKSEFEAIGLGFDKEDFAGFTAYGETNTSFDIIGLCQRVHHLNSYSEAATRLKSDLDQVDGGNVNTSYLAGQIAERHAAREVQREKMRLIADRQWRYARDVKGTIGENYLNSRDIYMQDYDFEPNMKFNGKVFNSELSLYIPAVIFKVSEKPDGELRAIHRIWIAADGSRKARLNENKKALGSIEGCGIWFGVPDKTLYICEGPEEALHVKYSFNRKFVVSTVYATNFHNLKIPVGVEKVFIVPDIDDAGLVAATKANKEYSKQCGFVKIIRGKTWQK